MLTTLENGSLKAVVKDNVNFKTYKGCIKISAQYETVIEVINFTYAITCDTSNQILEDGIFSTSVIVNATLGLENNFYLFDLLNQFTTSFVGCPIISYEIIPFSDEVEIDENDCTTNPCRDIKIIKPNIVTSPLKYNF